MKLMRPTFLLLCITLCFSLRHYFNKYFLLVSLLCGRLIATLSIQCVSYTKKFQLVRHCSIDKRDAKGQSKSDHRYYCFALGILIDLKQSASDSQKPEPDKSYLGALLPVLPLTRSQFRLNTTNIKALAEIVKYGFYTNNKKPACHKCYHAVSTENTKLIFVPNHLGKFQL